MKKIVLVGEAPSARSDPRYPFCGASGEKLAKLCGLSGYLELRHAASLLNVLPKWPGKGFRGEKGSRFPMASARRAAKRMKFDGATYVILVGRRVADAFAPPLRSFGYDHLNYFDWTHVAQKDGSAIPFTCIPHPSGCNRFYNYPENRERASAFMRVIFEGSTEVNTSVALRTGTLRRSPFEDVFSRSPFA